MLFALAGLSLILVFSACDDSSEPAPRPNGNNSSYPLRAESDDNVFGQVILAEYSDGSVNFIIELNNTSSGNTHPAYLYFDNVLEGNDVRLTLEPVNGATGGSQLRTSMFDDGTPFTFAQLLTLDGHVKVHASENDLGTVLAAGDIGGNAFTGNEYSYEIKESANSGASGTVTFRERFNSETLVEIDATNLPSDPHPAHIHVNTAVEGGEIAISLSDVRDNISLTNVEALDASVGGLPVTFDDLLDFDGHLNIHDPADLQQIMAQADIGINELSGRETSYNLEERNASAVSGTITFYERRSGESLARIELENTTPGLMHPAHIHIGTAAQDEAGLKAVVMNPVNGDTGIGETNIARLDPAVGGTPLTFEDLLAFDGYVNIHTTMSDLTLLAQTDIGQNALTGNSEVYALDNIPGVSGTATVYERINGNALLVINIIPVTGGHPAHIHGGSVAEGPGPIEVTLSPVNAYGFSRTAVESDDSGNPMDYAGLVEYNGYINVHASESDLATIIAQGDIGSNVN
ncbi:MAG: hypothetical protein P8X57_01655 [Cyclobacteriaceae bacterium]